ncbi:MAG: hypothetical protein V3V10_10060 [Planctomycetota bacterium]
MSYKLNRDDIKVRAFTLVIINSFPLPLGDSLKYRHKPEQARAQLKEILNQSALKVMSTFKPTDIWEAERLLDEHGFNVISQCVEEGFLENQCQRFWKKASVAAVEVRFPPKWSQG